MRPHIVAPATIFDMAELGGSRTALHWAVVKEMWSGGDSFSLRCGEELLGIAGFYPIEGGAECWFNVAPGAARHMLFLIRQARLTLAASRYPEIVVICTTAAGCRIASACGFVFVETRDGGEFWQYALDFRRQQQSRGSAETAGGSDAKADAGESRRATS